MNLGPMEIAIIAILIFALFGYKKLPDATRAVGRSLRIFKGEMKGMKDDDLATKADAQSVRAPIEQAPSTTPDVTINTPPGTTTVQQGTAPTAARQPVNPSAGQAASNQTQVPPPSVS